MTQTSFSDYDFTLKPLDQNLYKTFKTLCRINHKTTFTSDDFRMYGLDRFLHDTAHGIGGLFAKWKHHQFIVEVGQKRSVLPRNNLRVIRVYKFAEGETEK
jgi:hypothetical protein